MRILWLEPARALNTVLTELNGSENRHVVIAVMVDSPVDLGISLL